MSSMTVDLNQTFAALADQHRRKILDRVSRGPVAVSQLAEPLGMTVTGVLKHLHVLETAHLVTTHKIGRTRWCQLAPKALEPTEAWISSRRRLWDRRLDRFQTILEQQGAGGR